MNRKYFFRFMKTIKLITIGVAFATFFFFACSTDGNDPDPDPKDVDPTSISLTSNKTSFDLGEKVTFIIKTNLGVDITSKSTLKVNETNISGNSYTPNSVGIFTVKATYKALASNELSITANEVISVTSLKITSDVNSIKAGNKVVFTATATLSDGSTIDKTEDSKYFVDGIRIKGNKYIGYQTGEIKVKSTYDSATSNEISIQISQISTPANFTKKAVIEDYTGTWCGWCPRVSHAIELVEEQTDKVFAVAVHLAGGDPMENNYSKALSNAFNITGFPTAFVNRDAEWKYPEPSNISQAVDLAEGTANLGLAINSVLSENTIDIVVSTGFSQDASNIKLVLFILEGGINYNQSNYTSYYNGANPITSFEHNHVLRYFATNVLGDLTTSTTGIHHKPYSINIVSAKISNAENVSILAMLVNSTGKIVYNAQLAKINEDIEFD